MGILGPGLVGPDHTPADTAIDWGLVGTVTGVDGACAELIVEVDCGAGIGRDGDTGIDAEVGTVAAAWAGAGLGMGGMAGIKAGAGGIITGFGETTAGGADWLAGGIGTGAATGMGLTAAVVIGWAGGGAG